jgi:glucose-1-phosphate thymidylyltransferase
VQPCSVGVILAGGKGTRMYPITRAVPKELLTVGTLPIIDYNIDQMRIAGMSRLYIVVGYRKEGIMDYVGSGSRYGMKIAYICQDDPGGNASALALVEPFVDGPFCLVFGDEYLEPNTAMKSLVEHHLSHDADCTVGVIKTEDARATSIVKIAKDGRILDIVEKPATRVFWGNLGENGTHVFKPIIFDYIRKTPPGLGGELFLSDTVKQMVLDKRKAYAFENAALHYDIGVKKRFIEASLRALSNRESEEET